MCMFVIKGSKQHLPLEAVLLNVQSPEQTLTISSQETDCIRKGFYPWILIEFPGAGFLQKFEHVGQICSFRLYKMNSYQRQCNGYF